jgi:hypothetical protein
MRSMLADVELRQFIGLAGVTAAGLTGPAGSASA